VDTPGVVPRQADGGEEKTMAIMFRDFIPQIQSKKLFGTLRDYEDPREIVTRINRWIEQEQITVLSVETLLMPKMPSADAENVPTLLETYSEVPKSYQAIRVWYVVEEQGGEPATGVTIRLG
jgi:hypothetical protein